MILRASLANVMQQHGNHQHIAIDAFFDQCRRQRQLVLQLPFLNGRKIGDHLNRVFIHGVGVIHIELHHRHDGLEFGDEGRQESQLIHAPQRALRVAVFQQEVQKYPPGFAVFAHVIRDQMQIGAYQPHGVWVD